MKNEKIKTLEIKIFEIKNDNISSWGYVVKDVQNEKFFTLNKKYVHTIFGKNCLDNLYKIDGKTYKKDNGFKELQILKVHGTYKKV